MHKSYDPHVERMKKDSFRKERHSLEPADLTQVLKKEKSKRQIALAKIKTKQSQLLQELNNVDVGSPLRE